MPSPKTEPDGSSSRWRIDVAGGFAGFVQRLNTRLVLAIATVALAGLLVSAIAINQILPGYFTDQAQERLEGAALSIALLVQEIADAERERTPGGVLVEELRNAVVYGQAARLSAGPVVPATVRIYNERGQQVAEATPPNVTELEAQGFRLDRTVPRFETGDFPLVIDDQQQVVVEYRIVLSDAYTTRETTLAQIRGTLVAAGFMALVASVILGVLAANRVTAPIYRLRRLAARVAQGQLDERATASGVLEIDELGAQFNVMADQLVGTLSMLEADRDRLREFVADVSHELRTPISALRMYNELLGDGEVDEATRAEFLERSAEQIRRLEWLSTNLLDLSRIDAGIFPLDMRYGDLRDPIRVVVEANSEVAEERGISLGSEVPATPVGLRFDRERIIQLLTNLVGNALKFTPRGGEVSIRLGDEPDVAVIEVRDTGPGILAEELPHIFERFYRGTNTGEARASGSGLGLAIVRSIVEMHGGMVSVASVVGKGTEFRIELPRTAPETVAETPTGSAAQAPKDS